MSKKKKFHVVMIKPSHYDDDGYVIQWFRTPVPSNTLGVLYGLALDIIKREALGSDVEIVLSAYDETHTRVPVDKIIREMKSAGNSGFVGLVGVQSNQFPRSMDIAKRFREAGIETCIGGFHVSGCYAMLKDVPADIAEALDLGISLFAGEAEGGRLEKVFKDAYKGKLKPLYNYLSDLPPIEGEPVPFLPAKMLKRSAGAYTSFDAGRGCPFKCNFCSIINVQGRKSRMRSADDVERIIRDNAEQGIDRFFITDDNFARNNNWEEIFDRLIKLRTEEGLKVGLIIQVDTKCHRIPNFITKAKRAGVNRVYIGLENINPDNLESAGKAQNNMNEYKLLLQSWRNERVITYAGFITGFPGDRPEAILRDIKTIQRELPVDLMEFFFLTPLPGSVDHQQLYEKKIWMEEDMNVYDLHHITTEHSTMSKAEWQKVYDDAWDTYYTDEHILTVLRRARAARISVGKMMFYLTWFYLAVKLEGLHSIEAGLIRRKYRKDRRPTMPLENPFTFYPRRAWKTVKNYAILLSMLKKCGAMRKRIKADPEAFNYTDVSIEPVTDPVEKDGKLLSNQ